MRTHLKRKYKKGRLKIERNCNINRAKEKFQRNLQTKVSYCDAGMQQMWRGAGGMQPPNPPKLKLKKVANFVDN
jgi:hypothetical protein